jgi:PadR family transcriptional regulator, regulatory protein PadR
MELMSTTFSTGNRFAQRSLSVRFLTFGVVTPEYRFGGCFSLCNRLDIPRTTRYVLAMARETNPNFMNGVPELLILRLLQQEDMYGYEIVQSIHQRTDSVIAVGEGVVYPVLHRLEMEGALRSKRKTIQGRSRIYYTVTPAGSARLADLAKVWTNLNGAIQHVLHGGTDRGRSIAFAS